MSERLNERPIWTAGMEIIERALTPEALELYKRDEISRFWTERRDRDSWRQGPQP